MKKYNFAKRTIALLMLFTIIFSSVSGSVVSAASPYTKSYEVSFYNFDPNLHDDISNSFYASYDSNDMCCVDSKDRNAIINKAKSLTSGVSGTSNKIRKVYNWVRDSLVYENDAYYNNNLKPADFRSPSSVWNNIVYDTTTGKTYYRAVCAGYAHVLQLMLQGLKIPCITVYGYYYNGDFHAWNAVYLNGQWWTLDSTLDSNRSYSASSNRLTVNKSTSNFYMLSPGNYSFYSTHYSKYLGTDPERRLLDSKITLSNNSYIYDGKYHRPTLTVTYKGTKLVENRDYVVRVEGNSTTNVCIDAAQYKIWAEGRGYYAGKTNSVTFSIKKRPLTDTSCITATISRTNYTYDGYQHKPSVTVKYNNKVLVEGRDYNISITSYDKNGNADGKNDLVHAAKYKMNIVGINNYGDSKCLYYYINEKSISDSDVTATISQSKYTYDGNQHKPKLTVRYNGMMLVEGKDYNVSITSFDKNGIADGKNDLIHAAKYRMTITGCGNYTGTQSIYYYINEKSLSSSSIKSSISQSNFVFDWCKQKPKLTVTDNGKNLVEGVDYKVYNESYDASGRPDGRKDNSHVGMYKIWAEGIGNYTGMTSKLTYYINKASYKNILEKNSYVAEYNKNTCSLDTVYISPAHYVSMNSYISYKIKSGDASITSYGKVSNIKSKYVQVEVTAYGSDSYYDFTQTAIVYTKNKNGNIYGDVNLDGKVDVADATTIQRYLVSIINLTAEQRELADIDGDGKVSITDATIIQRLIAGL